MGKYREDGSIASANDVIWNTRYEARDYGVHKALILKVIFSDDSENSIANTVLYDVMILGGRRNGQFFKNVMDITGGGDRFNFSETIRKPTRIPANLEISNPANFKTVEQLNGSHVLLTFLDGDILNPVIIGSVRHTQNKTKGTSKSEGIQQSSYFNGIKKKIDKNGVFTFSKDRGLSLPIFANPLNILDPYMDEFVPTLGFSDIVKLTIDNEHKVSLEVKQSPATSINVGIDGLGDKIEVKMALGSSLALDGLGDSITYTTKAGMSFKVEGLADKLSVTSLTGSSLVLDGIGDSFTLKTAAGSELMVSGISGLSLKDALGDELTLNNGAVSLKNASGANLSFSEAGLIKLGNSSGDALQLIGELIQSLSTATYSGFGAPGSNIADLTQLLVKWKLITG